MKLMHVVSLSQPYIPKTKSIKKQCHLLAVDEGSHCHLRSVHISKVLRCLCQQGNRNGNRPLRAVTWIAWYDLTWHDIPDMMKVASFATKKQHWNPFQQNSQLLNELLSNGLTVQAEKARFEGMSLNHLGYMRFKIDFDLNGNSSKARSIRLHLITHYLKSQRVFGLSAIPLTQMDVCLCIVCMHAECIS